MLRKRPGWEFRRILKAQGSVKVVKPGQLVKFFDRYGIVLSVEVLRFLRIISTFKDASDELVEEVDYKSPYSVVVLSSSGDIMKIMDKDIEHV